MIYLKGCPRCRGDLFPERDGSTRYLICLQCGHTLTDLPEFSRSGGRIEFAGMAARRVLDPSRRN